MKQPLVAIDGTPLKLVKFEGMEIYMKIHVDAEEVKNKFKNRRRYADYTDLGRFTRPNGSRSGKIDY